MSPALAAGLQIAFVLAVLAIAYVPVGDYMARVYTSTRDLRVESVIYRVVPDRLAGRADVVRLRVQAFSDSRWRAHCSSYFLQRIQGVLPLS